MQVKGDGRVGAVETKKTPAKAAKAKTPKKSSNERFLDGFDVAPTTKPKRTSKAEKPTKAAVARDLAEQGKNKVENDRKTPSRLADVGRLMGELSGAVVQELITHFIQNPAPLRAAPMLALGELAGALLVELWGALTEPKSTNTVEPMSDSSAQSKPVSGLDDSSDVLDCFVAFVKDTEGQPQRRLAGTLYALQ